MSTITLGLARMGDAPGIAHLSRELIESALAVALRELVLPGLSMVGLPSGEIERWVAEGAPTS